MKSIFKILFFLIFMNGYLFGQNLVYNENFKTENYWHFSYVYDTMEWAGSSAYSGIINNQLIIQASQGFGCASADASYGSMAFSELNLKNYELTFYFHGINTLSALPPVNYLKSDIKGSIVTIQLSGLYINEPFQIQIKKNDSVQIWLNDRSIDTYVDELGYQLYSVDEQNNDSIQFEILASACFADCCHYADCAVDSIKLFQLSPVSTLIKQQINNNLFVIKKQEKSVIVQFPNNSFENKAISVYSIMGQCLKNFQTTDQHVILNLENEKLGIYLIKVTINNQNKIVKFQNY